MTFSLFGVFAAGLLTFLSPCVLPLAPVFTANLLASERSGRWGRILSTFWFSLGFTLMFVAMGLGISSVASRLGGLKPALLSMGGVLLALFGLKMMGVIQTEKYLRWMNRSFQMPGRISGALQRLPGGLHGLVFGGLFGLSWTPCVGPVLGGVLTYVASRERSPSEGALLLTAFSLGISLPLFAVAALSDRLTPVLNRLKRHLPKLEYAAGLGVFILGVSILNQARLQGPVLNGTLRQPEAIQAVTDSGDVIRLAGGDKSATKMLFFYSENCPVCHAMQKNLPSFVQDCSSDQFRFHRINVDRPENYVVANYFGIKAVPTVSVLTGAGTPLIHLVGYQTEGRLREAAKAATHTACRDQEMPDSEQVEPGKVCTVGKAC